VGVSVVGCNRSKSANIVDESDGDGFWPSGETDTDTDTDLVSSTLWPAVNTETVTDPLKFQ
jgi:hypothetical protein